MLSEIFWVAFITTATGFLLKMSSMAYKSKCKEFTLGCLKVIRDTETEERIEEFIITHPPIHSVEQKDTE